jgi:hypothetical protein
MNELNKNIILNSDNKIKFGSQNSGTSSSLNLVNNQRKDIYGNVISKKIKKHRISFADEIENTRDFVEVKTVNSYRQYNKISVEEGKFFIILYYR